MKILEAYPGLVAAGLALLLLIVIAPVLNGRITRWRQQRRTRQERQAKIDKAAEALMAHRSDNDAFYDYFGAYLNVADPDKALPNRKKLDFLINLTWLSETIFENFSVDWFAAHGTFDDYDTLEAGLKDLGQNDLVPAVRAARRYHALMEYYVYKKGTDPTDEDNRRFEALSMAIGKAYDRAGGSERLRTLTHRLLNRELSAMLA